LCCSLLTYICLAQRDRTGLSPWCSTSDETLPSYQAANRPQLNRSISKSKTRSYFHLQRCRYQHIGPDQTMQPQRPNSPLAARPIVLGFAKILFLSLGQIPIVRAAPVYTAKLFSTADEPEGKDPDDPGLWIYLTVAAILVLLGGAFAGLTIALMGQVSRRMSKIQPPDTNTGSKDEIYLQVIKDSGEGTERAHAAKVLKLLRKGKHWVLVTLLLSNVITNETLPIVLDRSLGGGWPAVLGSTVLIGVLFSFSVWPDPC